MSKSRVLFVVEMEALRLPSLLHADSSCREARLSSCRLIVELQSELQLPWRVAVDERGNGAVAGVAHSIPAGSGVVDDVENVEGLGAELHRRAFLPDRKLLEGRQVELRYVIA